MLALAKFLNAPVENYLAPTHPVQQLILDTVSEFSGVAREQVVIGVDGCAAPVFGVPVQAMALMYARLVSPGEQFSGPIRSAARRIVQSMIDFIQTVPDHRPYALQRRGGSSLP